MESAGAALRREMREELGVHVTVGRLLWLVENFFTFEGARCPRAAALLRDGVR